MAGQKNLDVIVVGCDGSWQSQKAVESATREASRRGTSLVLLSVARGKGAAAGLSDVRRWEGDAVESARAIVKRAALVAEATSNDVPPEAVVVRSIDAPALEGLIGRTQLLVLGGHGRGGQAAFSVGTVSGDLARRFRTPILLPRLDGATRKSDPYERQPEVHVGLSGRGDESELLRLAAAEAWLRGCALRVIRAVPSSHPGQRLRHELEDTWRTVRSVPECDSVPCHVDVVQDDPVSALLGRCAPDDVLVVGTRGGGTLAGLVHGSVARGVLDGLGCDAIVVPPGVRTSYGAQSPQTP